VCLVAAYAFGRPNALAVTALLALLEALLSAASAIFSAEFVRLLSRVWQRLFLTLGLLIAVVGVRFILPLAILCAATGVGPATARHLLASDPRSYSALLTAARPIVDTFAGAFLLIVFLSWVDHRQSGCRTISPNTRRVPHRSRSDSPKCQQKRPECVRGLM